MVRIQAMKMSKRKMGLNLFFDKANKLFSHYDAEYSYTYTHLASVCVSYFCILLYIIYNPAIIEYRFPNWLHKIIYKHTLTFESFICEKGKCTMDGRTKA